MQIYTYKSRTENQIFVSFSWRMIAKQKFSCTIFHAPQKDVCCTYGARYERAPNFYITVQNTQNYISVQAFKVMKKRLKIDQKYFQTGTQNT